MTPMKIAIVLITDWWRASIDHDGLAAALSRQGCEPRLVCLRNTAGKAAFPVMETTCEAMRTPAFWKEQGLNGVILYSWLREPAIIRAIRKSGTRVVLRADHDGLASARVFPAATWETTVAAADAADRFRCALHWMRRWGWYYRHEDGEVIAAIHAANAVAIESAEAAGYLKQLLQWHGEEALCEKLRVVPHSVPDVFISAPFQTDRRPPLIFCGGRWNDSQKDAPLLNATLERLLPRASGAKVIIAGTEHDSFSRWQEHPQVECAGLLPREELLALLGRCRFLLSSSRWETQPIGSLEMLCMGGSIVAPRLPGFVALADEGRSGTLALRRSADHLTRAALEELALWEAGQRNPETIASGWRARVSNDAVAAGLVAALTS